MQHTLQIDEGQRQMILLALAELSISRPGWDMALRNIARQIDNPTPEGPQMFCEFKHLNADRVLSERAPLTPLVAQQDDEETYRWLLGVNNGQPSQPGGFLKAIAEAALRADPHNYPMLRPTIAKLKQKYPVYRFAGKLGGFPPAA